MKGIEHFRKAEQLLELAELNEPDGEEYIGAAQAHAILAAATSMSNLVTVWGDIAAMMRADAETADAEPRTCSAQDSDPANDGGPCRLLTDHDGPHDNGAGWAWYDNSHYGDGTRIRTAGPLVTCNAAPADDGPERCGLAIGHDGLHEHGAGGGRIVSWSTPAEMATIAPARPYVAGAEPVFNSTATDLHMEMPL